MKKILSTRSELEAEGLMNTASDDAALEAGCYFDPEAAERVKRFFEDHLRHSKGQFARQKFTLLDWQWAKFIKPLFGWKTPDGLRRFRRAAVGIPKKNGKSTLLAGTGLYLLTKDDEPGAEVYVAAADRDQASIIYNEAANMVEASPALDKRVDVRRATKLMRFETGQFKALSAEVYTKEGINAHGVLFDELHAQPTPDLWNVLRFAGAARRQPLLLWISTAGVDREGICFLQWKQAKDVQESRAVDIALLPVIYEADETDDPWCEDTWKKVNPSYGHTISQRDMEEAAKEARENPALENNFRRYRLNQWTRQESRWIPMERWDACRASYTATSLRRQKCWAGLDLATTTDLNALVLLFQEGPKYRVLPYFWAPQAALQGRERSNRQKIDHWAQQNFIKLTSGNSVDYGVIRKDINNLAEIFKIREIGIDPWNATSLAKDLEGDGFKVQYVRTGFASMNTPTKALESLVVNGQIEHNSNPVLDWMFNNISVETDASGNIKPSKKTSSEKIDGVVAMIIALALAIAEPAPKKSVYHERGLQVL